MRPRIPNIQKHAAPLTKKDSSVVCISDVIAELRKGGMVQGYVQQLVNLPLAFAIIAGCVSFCMPAFIGMQAPDVSKGFPMGP